MPTTVLLPLLVFRLTTQAFRPASPILKSEFIYEAAPFPSCHASTIAETRDHRLVAAWFGGTAESNPDVVVYTSRLVDGVWTKPERAADGLQDGKPFACYNPVLCQPSNGPLLLFYKYGTGPQGWLGRMTRSEDDGKTWLPYRDLPAGVLGPIKNKPIELPHHIIYCPSSTEERGWRVRFEWTCDLGQTWHVGKDVNDPKVIGAIQPSILPLTRDHLRAVGRSQQGKVFAIDSWDRGKTWGSMKLLDVPNPNSGIDAVQLRDGRSLMVYNHTPQGRTPLNVAISTDAETWKPVVTLEDQPGEYSYPAVIQTHDGLVHITYTWHRQRIKHVVIDPKLLR